LYCCIVLLYCIVVLYCCIVLLYCIVILYCSKSRTSASPTQTQLMMSLIWAKYRRHIFIYISRVWPKSDIHMHKYINGKDGYGYIHVKTPTVCSLAARCLFTPHVYTVYTGWQIRGVSSRCCDPVRHCVERDVSQGSGCQQWRCRGQKLQRKNV